MSAAMEEWAAESTTLFITELGAVPHPRDRLAALFTIALGREDILGLEPAIVAHADHPAVAPVLRRVTELRIDYLTGIYTELGLDAGAARRQAVTAYAAYLGWIELRRAASDLVPEVALSGDHARGAVDHLIAWLTPPPST
ncbi:hypothetical protein [Spirillospora sp. CA-294931]|uniref:hypothetical protein n=1 Tax=Spirillospora sp. CA-294931 TaxID=3240042 RepID=UPI003D8B138D